MNPHNRRGIVTMMAAMLFFVTNDALVKLVSHTLPTPQLIFVRGAFTTLLLLLMVVLTGSWAQWRSLCTRSVPVRALLDSAATFTYLTALFHLPLGNATAINLAAPLFLTLLAVFFLRERVGTMRWALIVLGFTGVLLVVQPDARGLNAYALLCVVGTLFHAGRDLLTRLVPAHVPSLLITISTSAMVTLLSGLWALTAPWQPMSLDHLLQLGGAAFCLAIAYHLLTLSMRAGDMSVIGPFRYSGLLVALVLGYLLWDEVPNLLAWGGIALLVMAGLGLLHSQRVSSRAALDAATD
jgi:drug/metabolite transporter (DMT)-like permease